MESLSNVTLKYNSGQLPIKAGLTDVLGYTYEKPLIREYSWPIFPPWSMAYCFALRVGFSDGTSLGF